MDVKATGKYIRVSTRKTREVAALIRGKQVDAAMALLKFTPRKSALAIFKVLRSAVANAEENHKIRDFSNFKVKVLNIEMGPPLKRFMPRAHGRASLICKPTTHIKVVIADDQGGK